MKLSLLVQMAAAIHPYLKMKNYFDKHFLDVVTKRYRPVAYAERSGQIAHVKFNRRGRRHKFARFHEKTVKSV